MSAIITVPNAHKSKVPDLDNLRPRLNPKVDSDLNLWPQHKAIISFDAQVQANGAIVRRPLSGVSVKPNTRATVQIVSNADGTVQKVFNELGSTDPRNSPDLMGSMYKDASKPEYTTPDPAAFAAAAPQNNEWTDFFLSKVGEVREEKIQLTETFGDPILYVFGEKPRFLSFRGFLMNTQDFNWRAQFWHNWDRYFRASRLVEANNMMTIFFDDIHVRGYPINAVCQQTADSPNVLVFSFNFYVVDYLNRYMQDVAALHKMRLPQVVFHEPSPTASADQFVIRPGEYVTQGGYDGGSRRVPLMVRTKDGKLVKAGSADDPLVKSGRRKEGDVIVDSTRVLYENVFASNIDFARRAYQADVTKDSFLTDWILEPFFSAKGKTITSGMDAMAFTTNWIARQARILTNKAFMDSAATNHRWTGGRRRQQAMFGYVTHTYTTIVRNSLGIGAGLSSSFAKAGRWGNLIDSLATSTSINAVADYIGYAASAAIGGVAKTMIGSGGSHGNASYEQLTGSTWDINTGFVRDHSKSFNFSDMSNKEGGAASSVLFGEANQVYDGAQGASTPWRNSAADDGMGTLIGTGTGHGAVESVDEADDGASQPASQETSDAEQMAAAEAQESEQNPNSDGAMAGIDEDDDEEDGGEE